MTIQSFLQALHRLSLYATALFFLCIGCDLPLGSEPMGDYFPALKVGDTSQWDFVQYTHPYMSAPWTTWTGKMKWNVVSISNTGGTRTATIERILSGSWIMVVGIPRDSGIIAADTSYFMVNEDSNHKISFDLGGQSKAIKYGGFSASFDRYNSTASGKKIELEQKESNPQSGTGHGFRVELQQDIGITKFYIWGSAGAGGWQSTYTLVQ